MFKKSNINIILILLSIILFCILYPSIFSSKEGINETDCNNLHNIIDTNKDGSLSRNELNTVHNVLQPTQVTPPVPVVTFSAGTELKDYVLNSKNTILPKPEVGLPPPSEPKPIVYPTCKQYAGSVWAFCNGKPTHRWGVGPEGIARATGNCNYAASKNGGARWGPCP